MFAPTVVANVRRETWRVGALILLLLVEAKEAFHGSEKVRVKALLWLPHSDHFGQAGFGKPLRA